MTYSPNTIFDPWLNTLELDSYSRNYKFYGEWNRGRLKLVLVFQKSKGRPDMFLNIKTTTNSNSKLLLGYFFEVYEWNNDLHLIVTKCEADSYLQVIHFPFFFSLQMLSADCGNKHELFFYLSFYDFDVYEVFMRWESPLINVPDKTVWLYIFQ